MEKFELYTSQNGVDWYRCTICHALSRGKPDICPVCHSIPLEKTELNQDKTLDEKLNIFKKILDKYQEM